MAFGRGGAQKMKSRGTDNGELGKNYYRYLPLEDIFEG